MIIEFLPQASEELYEAVEYYESKQEGLGRRFRSMSVLQPDVSGALLVTAHPQR